MAINQMRELNQMSVIKFTSKFLNFSSLYILLHSLSIEYVLAVHCKHGNAGKTREILNMMEKLEIKQTECSFNYLIQCAIISG